MRLRLAALLGVVWFAAALAGLEYWKRGRITWLAAQSITVAVVAVLASSFAHPARAAARVRPGSKWFPAALFVLLTSHFFHAIGEETMRALRAWRLSAAAPLGFGGRIAATRSLGHALTGILKRSLTRAERVYSSLAASGIAK